MSRRTDVLCHSGGHIADTRAGSRIRGQRNGKKCEALRMWRQHRGALRKETILLLSSYSPNRHSHREDGGTRTDWSSCRKKVGVQATDEAQGAETKSWTGVEQGAAARSKV